MSFTQIVTTNFGYRALIGFYVGLSTGILGAVLGGTLLYALLR